MLKGQLYKHNLYSALTTPSSGRKNLIYQSYESLRIENEFVSPCVAVSDEGVQSANLGCSWKNFEGIGKRLTGAMVGKFAAKLKSALA
jgi:hypothetical protein